MNLFPGSGMKVFRIPNLRDFQSILISKRGFAFDKEQNKWCYNETYPFHKTVGFEDLDSEKTIYLFMHYYFFKK